VPENDEPVEPAPEPVEQTVIPEAPALVVDNVYEKYKHIMSPELRLALEPSHKNEDGRAAEAMTMCFGSTRPNDEEAAFTVILALEMIVDKIKGCFCDIRMSSMDMAISEPGSPGRRIFALVVLSEKDKKELNGRLDNTSSL